MPFEILSDKNQGSHFATRWQNLLRIKSIGGKQSREMEIVLETMTLLELQLDPPLRFPNYISPYIPLGPLLETKSPG